MIKKRISIFILILSIMIGISAKVIVSAGVIKVYVELNIHSSILYVGDTLNTLKASVTLHNPYTNYSVTWSSSNKNVATVDSKTGVVTAIATGSATITATSNADNITYDSCSITVMKAVTSVSLSTSETKFYINKIYKLNATIFPSDATDKTLNWSSSNTNIATVDATGNVSTKTAGDVTITATPNDKRAIENNVNTNYKMTVYNPVSAIKLDKSTLALSVPNSYTLIATISPNDNYTIKDVTWSSDHPGIATVDNNGKVTAVAQGTAIITATSKDNPSVTASCNVTVSKAVTDIILTPASINLNVNGTSALSAQVVPSDATNQGISWTSSDNSVVTVDNSGKIQAIANGTATIRAASKDNVNIYKECTVTVKTPVASISISKTDDTLYILQKDKLSASVSPDTASNSTVTWTSSDPNIVSVDNSGNVEAITAGTAIITAASQDSTNIKAQCTITVRNVEITELRLFKAQNQYDGNLNLSTSITTTPSVNNLLYQVWVEDSNGWRMVKNFSDGDPIVSSTAATTTTVYNFPIPKDCLTEDYSYKVHVRIKDSVTGVIYDQKTETATCVDSDQMALDKICTTAAVEGQCTVGDNLTITAYGKNISEYEFSISNGSSWDIIKDFDSPNSCSWTPKQIGNFNIKVTAKNGDQIKEMTLPMVVKMAPNTGYKPTELSEVDVPSQLTLGDSCAITAYGTGNDYSSLQYRFEIGEAMRTPNLVQDYLSANRNIYNWKPEKTGVYYILSYIKDNQSAYSEDRIQKYCKVVKPDQSIKIENVAVNNASSQSYVLNKLTPTTFTFDVTASGGTDSNKILYSFWRYDERGYRLIKDYSYDKTFSWTPTEPGVYSILVRIKGTDSGSYEDEKYLPYIITTPSTSAISITKFYIDGSFKKMTNHIITAEATNNNCNDNNNSNTLMYKFVVTNDSYGYKNLQDFSPLNTCNWLPNKAGTYQLTVYVKDATSGSHEKIITKNITITN